MMSMGIGMSLAVVPVQKNKKVTIQKHGYICSHCGERHVSDDTEVWCSIQKQAKKK